MSLPTLFLLAAAAALPCLFSARLGLVLTILAGFLQDPVRKAVPGEPVEATVLVGVFLLMTLTGMLMRGESLRLRPILDWNPVLRRPVLLFLLLVLMQTGVTFAKTGSPFLAGIGLLAYGASIPAFLLGYHLTKTQADVRRVLLTYVLGTSVMAGGVYMSVLGVEWSLLEAVGPGLHAFSRFTESGILELHQGFFRGSELAGWHGAAAACFLVILYVTGRRSHALLTSALVLFLLGAVVFTGRRKFLVETGVFLALLGLGLWWWRREGGKLMKLSVAAVMLVAAVGTYVASTRLSEAVTPYYLRGARVSEEAPDRLMGLAILPLRLIVRQNGFFGAGAGMGSQGAQYFGGGSAVVGSAAEGGVGKVLAELGVPGLILLLWVAIAFFRYTLSVMRDARRREPERFRLAMGMTAFLAANVAVFLIAHQIFGDVFVLIVLGWVGGVVCAVPHIRMDRGRSPTPGPAPPARRELVHT